MIRVLGFNGERGLTITGRRMQHIGVHALAVAVDDQNGTVVDFNLSPDNARELGEWLVAQARWCEGKKR